MKTALVIGAGGTIGSALTTALQARGVQVTGTTHATLDLITPELWPALPKADIAYLCAAITKLDVCENNAASTHLINVTHMQLLAERLLAQGSFVVFLSSNQVFDGSKPRRAADETPCPLNVYGKQKYEFEQRLLQQSAPTAVLRLTKVVNGRLPLLQQWEKALAHGETVEAFDDLVFAPVPLSQAVEALVQIGEKRMAGISQLSGANDISYFQIAQLLASKMGADTNLVVPVSAAKIIPAAFLPKHGTLQSTRFEGIKPAEPEEILF